MANKSTKMNWADLLSGVRLRDQMVKNRTDDNEYDMRNDFDDDYARLVLSSAVRRLQDKAQVFPLDNSDFVRTRLTHSHEVATIGRSLGISVEEALIKNKTLDVSDRGKLSALLSVAGLVHDLGNPPFGHFGEAAIQRFFKRWFRDNPLKIDELSPTYPKLRGQMRADFENFEGNAQTFRLLTKLNGLFDSFSYNLSVASLASVLKYPRSSLEGNMSKKIREEKKKGISYKKFGYMTSDKERFNLVRKYTGIKEFRHPATFLLEAADDIAYSAADIEDGCKKKVLNYEIICHVFSTHLSLDDEKQKKILESFKKNYEDNVKCCRPDSLDNAVQKLRIDAQGYMIHGVVEEFLKNHDRILNGEYDEEILNSSSAKNVREAFKTLAEKYIFSNREIITRELVGGEVISGLLKIFVDAVTATPEFKEFGCIYDLELLNKQETLNQEDKKYILDGDFSRTEQGKHFQLISDNYRDLMQKYPFDLQDDMVPSLYDRLQLVTDFVCGMTDSYALELYQKLSGIKL